MPQVHLSPDPTPPTVQKILELHLQKEPKKKLHPDLRCLRALATRSTMKAIPAGRDISPAQTQKGRLNLPVDLDLGFASSPS